MSILNPYRIITLGILIVAAFSVACSGETEVVQEIVVETVVVEKEVQVVEKEVEVVSYDGVNDALSDTDIDIRIFGKQTTREYRRMAVILAPTLEQAKTAAKKVKVIIN